MLPCADCAYRNGCLKWASRYCPDFRPTALAPPLTRSVAPRSAATASRSNGQEPVRITILHIGQRLGRLRA
jgi:hypothetical protein